jgi:hypothetical protein
VVLAMTAAFSSIAVPHPLSPQPCHCPKQLGLTAALQMGQRQASTGQLQERRLFHDRIPCTNRLRKCGISLRARSLRRAGGSPARTERGLVGGDLIGNRDDQEHAEPFAVHAAAAGEPNGDEGMY